MRKKVASFSLLLVMVFALGFIVNTSFLRANQEEDKEVQVGEPEQDEYYYVLDENGVPNYIEYDSFQYDESKDVKVDRRLRAATTQVAMIKGYTTYKEAATGLAGYTHGNSFTDAAYIQTNADGSIRVKQAGVVMDVPSENISIVAFDPNRVSTYTTSEGKLFHNFIYQQSYKGSNWVGYQQSYMAPNATYYSYDGHYFYTNYDTMLNDYRNNTYANSINNGKPYYNYYQFLSHRTPSSFTLEMLDRRVVQVIGADTTSKMWTAGAGFFNSQNRYGVNAGLMFGVAVNESGWGSSDIAKQKNNIFGHKAYDSSVGSASTYNDIQDCMDVHASEYLSSGYLSPVDYRYRGPHLGDKQSGINVKYASDPLWGEKAASQLYYVDANNGKIDYNKYSLAAVDGMVGIFNNTGPSKVELYGTGSGSNTALENNMILLLGEEVGTDGALYYKVQTDPTLNDARTGLNIKGTYNFSRDYGYIKASNVRLIQGTTNVLFKLGLREEEGYLLGSGPNTSIASFIQNIRAVDANAFVSLKNAGGAEVSSGILSTGMTLTLKENGAVKTYTVVIKGDINGDGQIFATDYVKVKNHIMGKTILSGAYLKAADVNGDRNIYATDYVIIKNYIMGKGSITQ